MVGYPQAPGASADISRATDPEVKGPELLPLAASREPSVRAAVAARIDSPMAALVSLGNDHDIAVLDALLRNPRTPATVVRKLADHRDSRIAGLAVQRLRNSFG